MTFTEAFILTLVGLVGLLMWLMVVAVRVMMQMAYKQQLKLIKLTK